MTDPTYPSGDRVLRGLVHWCETDECAEELKALEDEDRFAWNGFQILFSEAEGEEGIDFDVTQVRCPLDYPPPTMVDPPWVGELKMVGKRRPRKHWRLYFGEPINYPDHVVRIRLWYKLDSWSRRETRKRQEDAIKQAMARLKWHFSREGFVWSPFPSK